jgi:choline dehydrogenase-like flavoprotein/nucleoside-diphosphate-sugar epimerase
MPVLDSSEFASHDALPERLLCDVCIIGSGAAGMTIARELSATPLRVTILESGGTERQEAVDALNEIESVGWPRVAEQWAVRNRGVGGSTKTWSALCAPFDGIDLEDRDWVPNSGWPMEIGELTPYIARSAKHLGLNAGGGITDDRIWELTGQPRMRKGPEPDPGELLPMFWQYGRDPVIPYDKIRFAHYADGLGPNITLVTNATVVRINATESARAVESVEFAAADGQRWTLPAATVVVCAGGIENARLLLSSDNVAAQGLGNDHDLVGRFLMDHLRGPVGSFQPKRAKAVLRQFSSFKSPAAGSNMFQHGMRLSPAIQRAESLLNCAAWVGEHQAPDDPWESLIRFLSRQPGARPNVRLMLANSGLLAYGLKEHFIAHRALPRKLAAVTLQAMCEQVPNPDSRITLADRRDRLGLRISRIDWRVSAAEARTMRRMAELMAGQFARRGIDPPELADWVRDGGMLPQTFRDIAHPAGTTRMSGDPRHGVVDARCEVHGVRGLFVAGSSVFPTAGHANPTQMIVTLAVRLADTLNDRSAASAGRTVNPVTGSLSPAPGNLDRPAAGASDGGKPARVLVTGATGLIGRNVVNELLERGYRVRAVTSKPVAAATVGDRLEWCQLDFQQSLDFGPLVQECAAVVHLGAELYATERMQRSNVEATRALAEASEQAGVKFFCYTSSVAVYGNSRRRRVSEDSPMVTADRDVRSEFWGDLERRSYARTKLGGELAIKAAARAVDYVIVRPTMVVDLPELAWVRDRSKVWKHVAAARHAHHVYVRDVADAIAWFLADSLGRDRRSPGVRTFNLSEDDARIATYGQFCDTAYQATGDPVWRAVPLPWPVEWFCMILRARRVIPRHPFGRMLFSAAKLHAAGYEFRFGMSHLIAEFHRELQGTTADIAESPTAALTRQ